jgi:hypothetical protein
MPYPIALSCHTPLPTPATPMRQEQLRPEFQDTPPKEHTSSSSCEAALLAKCGVDLNITEQVTVCDCVSGSLWLLLLLTSTCPDSSSTKYTTQRCNCSASHTPRCLHNIANPTAVSVVSQIAALVLCCGLAYNGPCLVHFGSAQQQHGMYTNCLCSPQQHSCLDTFRCTCRHPAGIQRARGSPLMAGTKV